MEFERLNILIGNKIELFKTTRILIVGLGGVGGYVLEALIRSGFENITIVDSDIIEYSNLNRQIIATQDNIGKKKVLAAKERALNINPNANINAIADFVDDNFFQKYSLEIDYIIDACDTVLTKQFLIKYAIDNNLKIISCMGTGNRLNPSKLRITKLAKTQNDPLAKKIRHFFRNTKYLKVNVICSEEVPLKSNLKTIGTIVLVPMSAGNLCASFVINDLLD